MASVNLTSLDFDTIKQELINYLKREDSPFKDVDYAGSNINSLLDVLAYNTTQNAFYLNQVGSEMFIDTAQLPDSIISHAKELNYVPRSNRSARATISFTVTPPVESNITTLLLPKATSFTARLGTDQFTFSTEESFTYNIDQGVFNISNLEIQEGQFINDTFVYSTADLTRRFVLSDSNIDTSSISVQVIENNGGRILTYKRAADFLGVEDTSQSFFLQAAENGQYEILFGDNIVGRRPANGATIIATYRISSGELPNGARTFDIDGAIQGLTNISDITTINGATGGQASESVESVRFNAPRHYQNQGRAVTVTDYENILRTEFNEIEAIAAFGGEDATPPQFGKVFISVDVKGASGSSEAQKRKFSKFISNKTPLSIDPVFIDPEFLFIKVDNITKYDSRVTSLSQSDVETLVRSQISTFSTNNLNSFKKTLRYSRFIRDIDDAHNSIISNDTILTPFKFINPIVGIENNISLSFGFPLDPTNNLTTEHKIEEQHTITSSIFTFDGKPSVLEDDGEGLINIVSVQGLTHKVATSIGTVNYDDGTIVLNRFVPQTSPSDGFRIYARPASADIAADKNIIISIRDIDVDVSVEVIG